MQHAVCCILDAQGHVKKNLLPCPPRSNPLDMLEFLEIEREASDERLAVQSGEDHRDFEGSRLQDERH
jgi:hypothetical protein